MMHKYQELNFLQKKIAEIKVAFFKADTNENEFLIPNNIVSALQSDTEGNLLFYTKGYGNFAQYFENGFYASLTFSQKGGAYRLLVEGKAKVVKNDLSQNYKNLPWNNILIEMKIEHAEYFEKKSVENASSFKTRMNGFFSGLLLPHHYRKFDFGHR